MDNLGVVLLVIILALFGLWVWSLIHCISNKRISDTNKIIGVVLIVVLGILGSLIYAFMAASAPAPRRRVSARRGRPRVAARR